MNNIALLGNPNSGKTTLFNGLTGSNQHIGNWPGVTVEKIEGKYKHKDVTYNVIDLPGTYSLGAYSEDEIVARDFILKENPDLVINVVDASNIERNLYLTTQLLEMDVKVIIALNMMDEAEARGVLIDIKKLSKELDVPIIPTIASRETGLDNLKDEVINVINDDHIPELSNIYEGELLKEIEITKEKLKDISIEYPNEWVAIKLLEGDDHIQSLLNDNENISSEVLSEINKKSSEFELDIIDSRYRFINKLIEQIVERPEVQKETLTDKIDKLVTHKYLGIPIFALIMFLVFQLTFIIGEDLLGGSIEGALDFLGDSIFNILTAINSPAWFTSLIGEGLFEGVGAVLEFIPLIMILYFFLGILEDTGYMARAAYVMDGLMRSVGLQGKSFIPMIVGFGCNVPGIMATRTLEDKNDRMIATLINPFMSCGAKIPIYTAFVAAFFPDHGGIVLFTLYFLGILVALIMAKIFSKTLFKGESSNFIMELPPYRSPILKYVVRDMWEKVSGFIKRAGTVIFGMVILLWLLARLPLGVEPHSQESLLGMIGTAIAPIFSLAGYGNWQAAVSLFAGIAAKEVVVATLGMVYAGASEGARLVHALQGAFTPLSAASFLVMILLYTPCAAVIATTKKETNSIKWAVFMAVYTFAIGLIASTAVYQIGLLLGFK